MDFAKVFIHTHTTESLTLFIVGDKIENIQHGGVGPALVNLDNEEIERHY